MAGNQIQYFGRKQSRLSHSEIFDCCESWDSQIVKKYIALHIIYMHNV